MVTKIRTTEKASLAVIDAVAHKHNAEPGAVIPILQEIQETYGYVSPLFIERIAEIINVPASELFGIATFYAQFRLQPRGKNLVKVCHGTACHLGGAERISQTLTQEVGAPEGGTSPDGVFTIEKVACLGCCSLAPCMMVNDKVHARLTPQSIHDIAKEVRGKEMVAVSE